MQEDVRLRLQSERCMMQTKIVLLPMYTAPGLKVGVWVCVDLVVVSVEVVGGGW